MQQYFIKDELKINEVIELDETILHHIKVVLRKHDGYVFRLIDTKRNIYMAELKGNSGLIKEEILEDHELPVNITVVMSLIKNDKFDLTLQKLTELGVKCIVPYIAKRSVIKVKDEDKKLERYRKIVQEASEQSHRSVVPEIPAIIEMNDIEEYKSQFNFIAYEKEKTDPLPFREVDQSATIIIGPEGGFELSEIEYFEEHGFECKTLGKRILRAETAAIFIMSNFVGVNELWKHTQH